MKATAKELWDAGIVICTPVFLGMQLCEFGDELKEKPTPE